MKNKLILIALLSCFAWAENDTIINEPKVFLEDNNGIYTSLGIVYNRTYAIDSAWFSEANMQDASIGISGSIGYTFNMYFEMEGRILKSFYEEDYADVTTYSIFFKPKYPVSTVFEVYALLGYGIVKVDGESSGNSASTPGVNIVDHSDFQWGVGVNYSINKKLILFIDYTSLMADGSINNNLENSSLTTYKELSVDALTIGMKYHF